MAETEKKREVKFIQSLALAVVDKDNEMRHIQFVIVQDVVTGEFLTYMDVVDASKIKLADVNDPNINENELP